MRLAVSNVAWDVADDADVAELLTRHGVDAVDLAPGKYFPDPERADRADVTRLRAWWAARGIEVTGLQALLFGTHGLNLFGPTDSRQAMVARLESVCRVASGLGATRLVFGSPRNRDRSGLTDERADEAAVAFFREIGEIALGIGVMFCLEPNPERYGCNFMTTTAEAGRIVELVDHAAIRLQLDSGALTINGEDPEAVLARFGHLVEHVHASEPDLVVVGEGGTDHVRVASALSDAGYRRVVSLEMLAAKGGSRVAAVERALEAAASPYGQFSVDRAGP